MSLEGSSRAASIAHVVDHLPGVVLCAIIVWIATAVGNAVGLPATFLALACGVAMASATPLSAPLFAPGARFCSRELLRLGIALIGVRLSLSQAEALGWRTVALAVGGLVLTLVTGPAIGRAFGLSRQRSILSAGAVGICGASATMAVATIMPPSPERERDTVLTVATVTVLSTVAMVLYPIATRIAGLTDLQAGIFLGASIHDVAQVVGAGAMISPEATTAATATKLIRVACLAPAVMIIGWALTRSATAAIGRSRVTVPKPPLFLFGFVALAVTANAGLLSPGLKGEVSDTATLCLVAATAALGLRTSFSDLTRAGWRPIGAMSLQTVLLGAYAMVAVKLVGP